MMKKYEWICIGLMVEIERKKKISLYIFMFLYNLIMLYILNK